MKMRKMIWKPILITFAVSFTLGVLYGRWEFSKSMHRKWKDPEARQDWVLKRMDQELNLTAEQEAQISPILTESAAQMKAFREKMKPERDALKLEVRKKIVPLLTPEQQKKYDEMESAWKKRIKS